MQAKSVSGTVDESKPYAEYWCVTLFSRRGLATLTRQIRRFGTHPSGPSSIEADGGVHVLHDWLKVSLDLTSSNASVETLDSIAYYSALL